MKEIVIVLGVPECELIQLCIGFALSKSSDKRITAALTAVNQKFSEILDVAHDTK